MAVNAPVARSQSTITTNLPRRDEEKSVIVCSSDVIINPAPQQSLYVQQHLERAAIERDVAEHEGCNPNHDPEVPASQGPARGQLRPAQLAAQPDLSKNQQHRHRCQFQPGGIDLTRESG